MPKTKQLGLFAKEEIHPGDMVIQEYSLLTANVESKGALCDACSTELPPLSADTAVVGCPDCDDATFCNWSCLKQAQEVYHPALCGKGIDIIPRDPSPKNKPSTLYLLLLSRALAIAATQEIHPLDLEEVKYVWGDFRPRTTKTVSQAEWTELSPIGTLPFSFDYNILGPLHILEKMGINIFASLPEYDLWVVNTLYAKLRGSASGRLNRQTGHPEVAAVHPLWCLGNHDCDPNVQWEWGGQMKLWCREQRIDGPVGLKKGEEILNHYCDINLSVYDRRDWAKGSLGGWCMCRRCREEVAEMEHGKV